MRSVFFANPVKLALALAAIGSFTATAVQAKPIYVATNTDFSAAPTTISLGGGVATYTFTYIGTYPFDPTADAVMTGGTALVNSSSFPGPGEQPIPFQIDSLIGDNGYNTFTAFPSPAAISYSVATDFIGLKFTLPDGDHFGYAEVQGPTLIGYGYDDVPGTPIAAVDVNGAVPEPSTMALALGGLLFAGGIAKGKQKRAKAA